MTMLTVDKQAEREAVSGNNDRLPDRSIEFERIFNLAVREAQEENRRLGIPNYYEVNGRIVSDQEAEEIATGDPEESRQ